MPINQISLWLWYCVAFACIFRRDAATLQDVCSCYTALAVQLPVEWICVPAEPSHKFALGSSLCAPMSAYGSSWHWEPRVAKNNEEMTLHGVGSLHLNLVSCFPFPKGTHWLVSCRCKRRFLQIVQWCMLDSTAGRRDFQACAISAFSWCLPSTPSAVGVCGPSCQQLKHSGASI